MVPIWCMFWGRMRASSHSVTTPIGRWYHISRHSWPTLKRDDVIWDRYLPDSLKATTRQRRGAGIKQRMRRDGNGKFPRNWNLSKERKQQDGMATLSASSHCSDRIMWRKDDVISTLDANELGSRPTVPGADVSEYPLRPCNHAEFDTRVMLHATIAVLHGYNRILIIAKDTGLIIQGISFFSDIGADIMLVPLGIGNTLRNISIHDIYSTMSSTKAKPLPAFHALFFFIESSIVTIR